MALHTQLPIYKVAYGLFDVIMDLAKNMPRDFKASIGGKLRDVHSIEEATGYSMLMQMHGYTADTLAANDGHD